MLTHVTAQVFKRTEKLLEPTEAFRLVLVAKQVSMAQHCEGFEVDPERERTVLQGILGRLQALTEEGQNNLPVDIALGAYSMALGGEMAVAAYDMDAYCAEAAELRQGFAEGDSTAILVWKDAP